MITIPAYNEEKTIGRVIKSIKKEGYNNIIVVDDGSTDMTHDKAVKDGAIVYSHKERKGLAETFRTEMRLCKIKNPDIIVHLDADGQYEPKEIKKLVKKLGQGYDLVLGQRNLIEYMPIIKRIGNKCFSIITSILARQKVKDAQTGFRAFTIRIAKLKMLASYTYTQTQIIITARAGGRIAEVPCKFYSRKGKSRLMINPFHYAWRAGWDLFRIFLLGGTK